MKHVVIAMRDSALNAFSRPMFAPTTAAAVRSFRDEVNRKSPDNHMHNHPDDFELFQIAVFEDETGEFAPNIERLARAKDLINKE